MNILKKLKIVLIMLILLLSLSAVSASGNFTSLQDDIEESEDSISLTQDYVFDNETDDDLLDGIEIENINFTLNGNGHTLDGKSQARIFDITGHNITISNLKIINGKNLNFGGAITSSGNIILINVTFINNQAPSGGAINSEENLIIINSTFKNNQARDGGAIFSSAKLDVINSTFSANSANKGGALKTNSYATVTGCTFKDFKNITFSMIYGEKQSNLIIENSTFMNSQAKYATAVYSNGNVLIKKSLFKNIHANETAGAIGVKYSDNLEIDSCTFENTSSVKNGGAVYIDGENDAGKHTKVTISNNRFVNTLGDFGGAILGLGINTVIINNSFEKCSSIYDGGAIYLSQSPSASIIGNNFTENELINEGDGAAIYMFETAPTIRQSTFINNKDNAVYVYSCKNVIVDKSAFINNTVAIYAVFSNVTSTNTSFANDILSLNNTDYAMVVEEEGMHFNLINNTVDVVNLPARFDLREWGWLTPVKNQGEMGACWTFGTIAALESALLKTTGITYDLSENNVQDNMLKFSKYGSKDVTEGSREEEGLIYLLSWSGVIPTKYDTFDELGKISPLIATNESFHIQDAIMINPRSNSRDNDGIKRAIMKYGAVATSYAHDFDCYNEKTYSYYQDETMTTDHVIAIVGWDDNYPASNFKETPPGNGAFIIKNSWGTGFGDKGYMYISYYDISVLTSAYGIAYMLDNTENYTKNYETDLGGVLYFTGNDDKPLKYQNNYESVGNDRISAVGTYFHALDNKYTLEIYINGQLKYQENGTKPYDGYHTIKLSKEIPIAKGDNVSLVMTKNKAPIIVGSMQHYMKNTSFKTENNVTQDLITQNATVSLKMYTKDLAIYSKDLVKIYKNDSQFEVNVGAVNQTVVFEINGANYTRISDENGTAHININLIPGDYVIRTTFNGTTVENTVKVLSTLIAKNLVKYFRNESQFYISLIDGAGNPVPNFNITMNINGVFYNRTTNANGTARLNINLNPGEYILTAIDPLTGLQMSYNITVLPVLTADDLNMTYLDGSQFEATLVDGEGNALEGVNITFNINGVFYNRTTDENGTARLNIRLMVGEYIITSQYENAVISNKITITPKED